MFALAAGFAFGVAVCGFAAVAVFATGFPDCACAGLGLAFAGATGFALLFAGAVGFGCEPMSLAFSVSNQLGLEACWFVACCPRAVPASRIEM
jgi:hypothetical protein